jgi:hypothetical protein
MSNRRNVTPQSNGTTGFNSEPIGTPAVTTPAHNNRRPFKNVRAHARVGGIGSLTLASLAVAAAERLEARPSENSVPDDGNIQFKDLTNDFGVIQLTTTDGRVIILDDPGETVLLRRVGSSVSESHVANSMATMLSYANDQQNALKVFALGQSGPAGVADRARCFLRHRR